MGAWGLYPTESDATQDSLGTFDLPVSEHLRTFRSEQPDKQYRYVGLTILLLKRGFCLRSADVNSAFVYIKNLRKHHAWLTGYSDPDKLANVLAELQTELQKLIQLQPRYMKAGKWVSVRAVDEKDYLFAPNCPTF